MKTLKMMLAGLALVGATLLTGCGDSAPVDTVKAPEPATTTPEPAAKAPEPVAEVPKPAPAKPEPMVAAPMPDGAKYMVVDISGGEKADAYPVTYLDDVPSGGWTDEYKTTKIVLRRIPAGTFTMGSPVGERGHSDDETQHEVTLSSDYLVGVFEMTQKQYELLMGSNPSKHKGDTRPVDSVKYKDFVGKSGPVSKLTSKTGLTFALPTEAQWEYACRAGTTTAWNNGTDIAQGYGVDENLVRLGRYDGNKDDGKGGYSPYSTAVGSYEPNAWGLYDMHGNLTEYCFDWYEEDLGASAVTDPAGPGEGNYKVVRGGCFTAYASATNCRSAERAYLLESYGYDDAGFRLTCAIKKN